ncbi:DNA topoisomerase 1 [Budvicia aquatica]|uniref:DNA topoisomerase 1 n=2 Tax=Budvicia aquatica TaxID=82979 RepID=A0A484ZB94_9GAMM|nr:DNA topoisomerase [Budvicia aquatica]VFS45578.1 DNA topoisomerase 1 [Budvicia aquatica]
MCLSDNNIAMTKTALFAGKNEEVCPECGAPLVIRSGKQGPFKGCSRYPECTYILSFKPQSDGHVVKVLEGQYCPQCNETLVLRQGRYGMFIGCSSYPACEYIASIDKPDETHIACPQCKDGKLLQRKSRYGKVFHSCDRYPECQFTLNHTPVAGTCAVCNYPLLLEKRTSQGVRLFCASKLCGKQVPIDESTDKNEE